MPTRRCWCIPLFATALGVAGCDVITGLTSGDCTTMPAAAISITVADSISGLSLTNGTTVRAQDGAFADSVTMPVDTSSNLSPTFALAWERPGTYQVIVRHEGYRDWSASDVRVIKDVCHVRTAFLMARLIRVP